MCIRDSYSAVAASGFRIKGKIVDANNNQPIDFADVLLFREGDVNPVFHALPDPDAVSYTHLDVYKRQEQPPRGNGQAGGYLPSAAYGTGVSVYPPL